MNLTGLLQRSARIHPERVPVFRGMHPVWTYAALADGASRLAAGLREGWRLAAG
jgi:non-ribosomal peptide synthetase component E (peptide arylation enzyme)